MRHYLSSHRQLAVFCVGLLAASFACAAVGGGAPAPREPQGRAQPAHVWDAARLQSALDSARREAGAPGAILAITSATFGDAAVAVGLADLATRRPMAPDAPWYIGSATKTYTAASIIALAAQGRLTLDDTLGTYVSGFPNGGRITLRHLLTMTSGLKDFYLYLYLRPAREEMIAFVTKRWSEDELIGLAARFGHHFEPGAGWDYSSANYYLLGVVIERVMHMPLARAYRELLLAPLSLERTWLHRGESPRGIVPTGYMGPVAAWKHSEMFGELGPTTILDSSSVELAAGGLVATAADGAAFLRALLQGNVVPDRYRSMMTTFMPTPPLGVSDSTRPADLEPDGYGMGLVRSVRPGYTLVGHGGLYNGHSAGLWSIAGTDLVIAIYLNRGFINQRRVLDRLVPVIRSMTTPRR